MQGASKIGALATWESSEKVQLETFEQCFTWLENHPSSSMTIPHFSLKDVDIFQLALRIEGIYIYMGI